MTRGKFEIPIIASDVLPPGTVMLVSPGSAVMDPRDAVIKEVEPGRYVGRIKLRVVYLPKIAVVKT